MKLFGEKLSESFINLDVLFSFFSKETTNKTFKRMAEMDVQKLNDHVKFILRIIYL